MGVEIERKFLVVSNDWKKMSDGGVFCRQGYLLTSEEKTVRVRLMGDEAFLTIKGAANGVTRAEFEYSIPVADAEALLKLCGNCVVEKVRYCVRIGELIWEIDVFEGAHQGLVIAEVELESENQAIDLPAWIGKEVSTDPRYYNAVLAKLEKIR
jgi:CYTH domain-containing protein